MKDIFYELINEAKTGNVLIDNESWPIGFDTIIGNNEYITNKNLSVLKIDDEELFFKYLEDYIYLFIDSNKPIKYLSEKDYKKLIMAYLFVNATTEDFLNPISYIKRRIDFLNDNTFHYLSDGITLDVSNIFKDSELIIKNEKNSLYMETPSKITLTLVSNNKRYSFPSISYGISKNDIGEKVCYIYSILSPKEKINNEDEEKYKSKINRQLYKVNKNVIDNETNEYKDYKNGLYNNYYPENISDVSPSFIIALMVFINLLKKENIENVKGVVYLPLRYLSRDISANLSDKKEELIKRNNFIQSNITDKFIRTFRRIAYHISDIEILSFPYEMDEYINLKIHNKDLKINNEFLENINMNINL